MSASLKRLRLCALGLTALLLLIACRNDDPEPTPQPPVPAGSTLLAPAPDATSSAVAPSATAEARLELALTPIAEGFEQPTGIVHAGDGSGRLFILEQAGTIRVVDGQTLLETPFLDLTEQVGSEASEQGLLGMAFHPDYAENGVFFVHYSDLEGDTMISRFQVSDDPNVGDPGSEQVILQVDQPAANHNGGQLVFGPDGYLYIGLGDGGGGGDTYGNAQNLGTLLGSIMRVDVDNAEPYAVPPDNPFIDNPDALGEIWAFGLRNPWSFSFDRATGDLYIADVGQSAYEEINLQLAISGGGENYGWPILEGTHCYEAGDCEEPRFTPPIAEYSHDDGCSVTGGFVYRGATWPVLDGIYLFGDYCSGLIWGLVPLGNELNMTVLLESELTISAFGEDEAGELYLVDHDDGVLYAIGMP